MSGRAPRPKLMLTCLHHMDGVDRAGWREVLPTVHVGRMGAGGGVSDRPDPRDGNLHEVAAGQITDGNALRRYWFGRRPLRCDSRPAHVPPRSGPLPEDSTQCRHTSRTAAPMMPISDFRTSRWVLTVFGARPASPSASQSSIACATVYVPRCTCHGVRSTTGMAPHRELDGDPHSF